jgi:hypothetical protein
LAGPAQCGEGGGHHLAACIRLAKISGIVCGRSDDSAQNQSDDSLETTVMIPIGQAYSPAGVLDARSILITSILGVSAGVAGAALVWVWELSPIPTLVILTALLQGAAIGWAMSFAVGRLRIRNPRIVATVGFVCGLLSVGLVHYGHYLHMVSTTAGQMRSDIAEDQKIAEGERQAILAQIDADPSRAVSAMLLEQTGHSGFRCTGEMHKE